MSSQAVRNNSNTSIRRVITDVKRKVQTEGKKKVMEMKDQLLSPDTIIMILQADINENTCSIEGRSKLKDKADDLIKELDKIDEIAVLGITTLNSLEEKIGGISSKVEIPNAPNPLEAINSITEAIKPITDILNYVIMASPAIIGSQTSVAGVGATSGTVITQTNNSVNLAKVKIAEYTNLFQALPMVLDHYISKADIIVDNISQIKDNIQMILDEIAKLKLFIIYMQYDFTDKCNNLNSAEVPPVPDPPIVPVPTTLEDIIAKAEELYGNILEDLIALGDKKAIERIYTLGEQFQRIKNTRVRVIDI